METLQIRAANMLYQDQTGRMLDDPYLALDYVTNLPSDWYPRTVRFRSRFEVIAVCFGSCRRGV